MYGRGHHEETSGKNHRHYMYDGEEWNDWADIVKEVREEGDNKYLTFDNLPVKGYLYPLDQVEKAHDLSHKVHVAGGEAAICPDCGYMVLEASE